jgi:hypothetical protein
VTARSALALSLALAAYAVPTLTASAAVTLLLAAGGGGGAGGLAGGNGVTGTSGVGGAGYGVSGFYSGAGGSAGSGGGADDFGGGGGGSYAAASISGEVGVGGEKGDDDRFTPDNGEVTIGSATFDYTGAPVAYTITTTTSYDIVAYGAQGGGTSGGVGGYGAEIGGDFTLLAGTVLGIDVGGAGGTELDHGGGGGGGSFVWIVSQPVVPEPSTWAMMLIGFAGLGFLSYRTSRRTAAAAV